MVTYTDILSIIGIDDSIEQLNDAIDIQNDTEMKASIAGGWVTA